MALEDTFSYVAVGLSSYQIFWMRSARRGVFESNILSLYQGLLGKQLEVGRIERLIACLAWHVALLHGRELCNFIIITAESQWLSGLSLEI